MPVKSEFQIVNNFVVGVYLKVAWGILMLENDLSCLEYLLNQTSLPEKGSRIWEGVLCCSF